jgi:hypothetical protein
MRYEVIVGNIGLVCDTDNRSVANNVFDEYVDSSKNGRGKAFNEEVTMLINGIVVLEYIPAYMKINNEEINQDEVREYPRGRFVDDDYYECDVCDPYGNRCEKCDSPFTDEDEEFVKQFESVNSDGSIVFDAQSLEDYYESCPL